MTLKKKADRRVAITEVTINGVPLNRQHIMTLRVAVASLLQRIAMPIVRQTIGEPMAAAHQRVALELQGLLGDPQDECVCRTPECGHAASLHTPTCQVCQRNCWR